MNNSGILEGEDSERGAVPSDDTRTGALLEIREGINIPGKDSFGKSAAGLINDGDAIFLDASISSLYVKKHIKSKKALTVIITQKASSLNLQAPAT